MVKQQLNPILIAVLVIFALMTLCGCSAQKEESVSVASISVTVKEGDKFDCAMLDADAQDFEKAGFTLGDSCDVEFSNGFKLEDVPYFNGFYVKTGLPVIVAYPKFDYVSVANNNRDLWTPANLTNGDTAKIMLKEKGKFKSTQEALSQTYSVDRADYATDEQFSNFRALKGGNLKENFLFRGASPFDNSRGRAGVTDSLVEKSQIKTIVDLADTKEEMQAYFADASFNSAYSKSLYDEGKVAVLGMGSNYDSAEYKVSLAQGLRLLIDNGGPAYIHCMEGKDRTGFVCMLLEAFSGATYDEMEADYMQTYANYYGFTQNSDPEKYDAICSLYFNDFCQYLAGNSDEFVLRSFDYTEPSEAYLTSCGLSGTEIESLRETIS